MDKKAFLREVDRRLKVYGDDPHGNPPDPIDDLIFIVLSTQTEEYLYLEAYNELTRRFANWEELLELSVDEIAAAIRHTGLQNKKARHIRAALSKIKADCGALTLAKFNDASDVEVLRYLQSLPGISAKSARCIMMYSLGRSMFPVDTHVWRICRRLGIAPSIPKPSEQQQCDLEDAIPTEMRYSLHANMVSHGRQVCLTYWPRCNSCVLADICPSRDKPDNVWADWRKPKGAWAHYSEARKS